MLNSNKINIESDSMVGDVVVAHFTAFLNLDAGTVRFMDRQIDADAYKEHRDAIRADRATFEDSVYQMMDSTKSMFGNRSVE